MPATATLVALLGAIAISVTAAPAPVSTRQQQVLAYPYPPRATHGGVASEAKECSAIGRDLLAQGVRVYTSARLLVCSSARLHVRPF